MTFDPLAPVPLVTADLPGIGGRLKTQPEDFEVEEIPAYEPSGQGEFLYLWMEKRSLGAEYFVRQIARKLDIAPQDIGTAGLKDRHAITRQMVSLPAAVEPKLACLDGDGMRVLRVGRHSNKLKPGHLRGNRFRILLRDIHPETPMRLPALIERLRAMGLANFYGAQRFGHDGETYRMGSDLLAGQARRVNPFLRRLALSAVQSALFNRYLATRLADGLFRRVLDGDVMGKWPQGGMFIAQDLAREQERFEAGEIVPTGPIFGRKMFAATGAAALREADALAAAGLTLASFNGFGKLLSGTRRYTLVHVEDLHGAIEPEGVRLSFTLPAGSYATVLIHELSHTEVGDVDEGE